MKRNKIIISIFILAIIASSTFSLLLMKNENQTINLEDYFIKKEVLGIVEGPALMFDSENYFSNHPLESFTSVIKIESPKVQNLRFSIGYKPSNFDLTAVPIYKGTTKDNNGFKEIELWNVENNFPENSFDFNALETAKDSKNQKSVHIEWDLMELGFTENEYIKADERIWFIRVSMIDNTELGYYEERDILLEDGSIIKTNEFIPYINCLKEFQLKLNGITFATQFYPYFDGLNEIVIPIKGIDYELQSKEDIDTSNEKSKKDNYSTTMPGYVTSNDKWCVVFATSKFKHASDIAWPSRGACLFAIGSKRTYYSITIQEWQYLGVTDYGWNVIYCMDSMHSDNPLETVDKTYDRYFNQMMDDADARVGSGDQLIVYVSGHGGSNNGVHHTLTYNTKYTWDYVIKRDEYRADMDAVTSGGTYAFLIVHCCEGYGFDSWSSSYHNNRLEIWSHVPYSQPQSNGGTYVDFYWYQNENPVRAAPVLFEKSYEGDHVTNIGTYLDNNYNYFKVQGQSYWGSYQFRIRSSFEIDDFHQFFLRDENNDPYITSTQSDSEIEFYYSGGGTPNTYLEESYYLIFADCDDDFSVELTVEWSVYSDSTIWHTLLEVGSYDYFTNGFTRHAAVGTRDSWSGNSGYYRLYQNGQWYNSLNYGEVGTSKSNVKFIVSRTMGQVLCRIMEGSTIKWQRYYSSSTEDVNAIRIFFKHHTSYFAGPTTFTINSISAEIEY
ncbi:MAG: hypothetical protein FK733_14110 [Asgard group archaeon]|nr:hypothetical protein [Asgard group archaeon]